MVLYMSWTLEIYNKVLKAKICCVRNRFSAEFWRHVFFVSRILSIRVPLIYAQSVYARSMIIIDPGISYFSDDILFNLIDAINHTRVGNCYGNSHTVIRSWITNCSQHIGNLSRRFYSEYVEETYYRYHMRSDLCSTLKILNKTTVIELCNYHVDVCSCVTKYYQYTRNNLNAFA